MSDVRMTSSCRQEKHLQQSTFSEMLYALLLVVSIVEPFEQLLGEAAYYYIYWL